jgi:hypothetical protein
MLLQVFYYLRELDEALSYALGAGTAFDFNGKSEYVSTIIGTSSLLLPITMMDAETMKGLKPGTIPWLAVRRSYAYLFY